MSLWQIKKTVFFCFLEADRWLEVSSLYVIQGHSVNRVVIVFFCFLTLAEANAGIEQVLCEWKRLVGYLGVYSQVN